MNSSAQYCPACGQATFPGRYCSSCGQPLPSGFPEVGTPSQQVTAPSLVQPDPDRHADRKQSRVSTRVLVLGIAVAVLVVAAIAVLVTRATSHPTVHGSMTLMGGGGYTTSTPCVGTSNGIIDNSDMRPTAPIKILDASGTIIGTGALGEGQYVKSSAFNGTCRFTFEIPLDASSTHYQIVIAERPPFDFTDTSELDLTLGGPRP